MPVSIKEIESNILSCLGKYLYNKEENRIKEYYFPNCNKQEEKVIYKKLQDFCYIYPKFREEIGITSYAELSDKIKFEFQAIVDCWLTLLKEKDNFHTEENVRGVLSNYRIPLDEEYMKNFLNHPAIQLLIGSVYTSELYVPFRIQKIENMIKEIIQEAFENKTMTTGNVDRLERCLENYKAVIESANLVDRKVVFEYNMISDQEINIDKHTKDNKTIK